MNRERSLEFIHASRQPIVPLASPLCCTGCGCS
jgi:hypothetical protein